MLIAESGVADTIVVVGETEVVYEHHAEEEFDLASAACLGEGGFV